ncbi:MAG: hypothetical protein IPF98_02290 [Gemmatimonadetes bacterium]|nr:hypothetical protein [Gemmatimonadota bacterium]
MPRTAHPALRLASAGTLSVALVLPWLLAAEPTHTRQLQPPDAGLVPVVGHWTPVQDEGAALRADGERWTGQTPPEALATVARSLFGAPSDRFVTNNGGAGAFPLAVWRPTADFTGGTVRVRFKMLGGKTDQNAGIAFGLQRSGRYWFMRYNTKDGDMALWEFVDGERSVLAHGTTSAQLPLNVWHELTLTVSGTAVSGAVNGGALRLDHTLDSAVSGRIGLWTKRDAVTVFRDFRVTP